MKRVSQFNAFLLALALHMPLQLQGAELKTTCKKVFGRSVFDSFQVEFKPSPRNPHAATTENAYRKVEMVLTYERSQLDTAEFAPQFKSTSTVYDIVHGTFQISFEDLNDYAGGTINFDYRDDERENLAIMQYNSDGIDAFGVFECSNWPKLGW